MDVAPVTAFETGTNEWQRLRHGRGRDGGCTAATPLYLQARRDAGLRRADRRRRATADYVSDPAHPVPFRRARSRPIGYDDDSLAAWLADDQREVSGRPDVLTFTGPSADRAGEDRRRSRSSISSPRPAARTATGW